MYVLAYLLCFAYFCHKSDHLLPTYEEFYRRVMSDSVEFLRPRTPTVIFFNRSLYSKLYEVLKDDMKILPLICT